MELEIRRAVAEDLPAIVELLANDPLGAQREKLEDPLPESYHRAFAAIAADPNQQLVVGESAGRVVATLQLTIIPYLTYRGGRRAQIEAVRVARSHRGTGLGRRMFEWAIERARQGGCHVVQLTSDKRRPDALQFYAALGFAASHEGLKLHL